jgi:hypothetical protein
MPSSPWHLDYAPDSCTLARSFGKDAEAVTIKMEQFVPGLGFDLTVMGRAFRSDNLINKLHIAFGPDRPLHLVERALSGTATTAGGQTVHMLLLGTQNLAGLPGADIEDTLVSPVINERAITELAIARPAAKDFVLKLGPMDKPMDQMRICIDELLTHWGLDPAKQRTLSRKARPLQSPGTWLRSGDYPRGQLYKGASAQIHFRLTVGEDGLVSDCAIQQATKGDEFAATTCALLRRRARFEPALDAAGRPVASYYVNAVRWIIDL